MAENPIEQVRAAETEADARAREVAQQAAQMVDDAHSEAVRLANDAEDAARKAAAEKVAAAHQASQKTLEAAMADLDGEMAALASAARANQPQAVKMILDALA